MDLLYNPIGTAYQFVSDFSPFIPGNIVTGTRKEKSFGGTKIAWGILGKTKGMVDWFPLMGSPMGVPQTAEYQTLLKTKFSKYVTEQEKTEEGKKFWNTPVWGGTDVPVPKPEDILPPLGWDWGKIGQYALIGVVALAGVWLLGKYIGGKK